MEVGSGRKRQDSQSSFGSLCSSNIDVDTDIPPLDKSRPLRKRLGTEMAIIAATSPEIKALNLPTTPSFPNPQALNFHDPRTNSNGTNSPCSTLSTCSTDKMEVTLTPLLASMDDVEESSIPADQSEQNAMPIFLDETEDLIRSFQNNDLGNLPDKNGRHIKGDNKENIHPNLPPTVNGGRKQPFGMRQTNTKEVPPPKAFPLPRRSLHRRASYQNLPSPDEIGNYPLGVHKAASCGNIPIFPSYMDQSQVLRRPDNPPQHRRVERLKMMTGFR